MKVKIHTVRITLGNMHESRAEAKKFYINKIYSRVSVGREF